MGFVKTTEEIAHIQAVLAAPRFVGAELLVVDFLTRPQIVASILPPGLEPAAKPVITVTIGRWRSNCVGDFTGASVQVSARHGDLEGAYMLAMYMDSDRSVFFGRDLFGEPKKMARTSLHRHGPQMHGYVERDGVRLIDLRATLGPDAGAARIALRNFNIKATPSCTGVGCEDAPLLTVVDFDCAFAVRRKGEGRIALQSTAHDPLGDLEIGTVRQALYLEGDMQASCRPLARLSAVEYLPYLHGRLDFWPDLSTEGSSSVAS
ncbi:acetoacetate decarboxylase family protein [Xanthobacter autotrophicus]|uniref:acetoacetate decarboxylase family protein n=1 Tax=Xanthobacter autotrophicus TaxID=280 RepID=UPI0037287A51